jgi:hypothetical protein
MVQPNPEFVIASANTKGHTAAKCKSVYTNTGKYIGKGEPPPWWTKRNAEKAFEEELLKQQKRKKTVQA